LLRAPHDARDHSSGKYEFVEDISNETLLWGNASFAFAAVLAQTFAEHGCCVNPCGQQSDRFIEGLPLLFDDGSVGPRHETPMEFAIGPAQGEYPSVITFSYLGLIPVCWLPQKNAWTFMALSAHRPKEYIDPDSTAKSRLVASLPALFLVSRFSHYLKVIQRENIGAAREKDDLQYELDEWLNQYVIEDISPSPAAMAKYPLSMAKVEVSDIADNPDFFKVKMTILPHYLRSRELGVDGTLSSVWSYPAFVDRRTLESKGCGQYLLS
jgi:type VI secretion system protein ImpC